ncbi:FixH family protein [Pseudoalteromonas shioyasakiensis]|uniref:FixH family protein n=1 Tax=Pseudoalteromonas TaxID=53246 RepID=UPI000C95F8D8|nr:MULTISPECIES: FixH family protein [Pseudoalteromonas]MAD04079.1 CcoH-like protein [Pseudoalteromonas sp.]MCP4585134.1 FixH family protein [Pseudoalteromonas sp.]MCQ8881620.1 FixH family protein [Pseudoalteromonas shioyasakiensis]NIZ07005.1 FixH family protein [Pseudoalteromonas sp. HF66]QLE09198.1 FixH family protein [Pseudoalteromonas shioyasakiensis]|tara:strand:+ start:3378 stop:3869 length:492 start_codon:yes stop_codon:yes gene_type:complete
MKPTPWYKNFWPWFLISFPLAAIIGCAGLIYMAIGNGPDMVVDDYYKKGKAINLELSKFNKAKALYLHGDLNVTNDKVAFTFTKGDASNVHSLKMSFYHRTIKANDFDVSLMKNAHGDFTALLDAHVDGAYTVFIEPIDNSWKLKEDIILPTDKTISISPEYK